MSMKARTRGHLKSAWTPMSDGATNNKLYEERSGLVNKWFDKWTDDQRKKVFDEMIKKCKPKQLEYLRQVVDERAPIAHRDFTSVLPRVISLYIFSFLDPRSLSRCSQVSWYWKFLTELDVLWMAKCLKLGWYLSFTPSSHESGMWKKNYVEHIKSLQVLRPMTPGMRHKLNMSPKSMRKGGKDYELDKHKIKVPWKGSDPVPQDTWRYNVLDNNDVVEEVNKQRQKKVCGDEALRVAQTAKSKVNTGNILRSSSMTRMNTIGPNSRKVWAELKKKNKTVCIDVPRPGPVSPPPKTHRSTRKSPTRSARDPPSSNLFSKKPWNVPDYDSDN